MSEWIRVTLNQNGLSWTRLDYLEWIRIILIPNGWLLRPPRPKFHSANHHSPIKPPIKLSNWTSPLQISLKPQFFPSMSSIPGSVIIHMIQLVAKKYNRGGEPSRDNSTGERFTASNILLQRQRQKLTRNNINGDSRWVQTVSSAAQKKHCRWRWKQVGFFYHFSSSPLNRSSRVWLLCMAQPAGSSSDQNSWKLRKQGGLKGQSWTETCLKLPTFDCEKETPKDLLKIVLSPKDWKVLS